MTQISEFRTLMPAELMTKLLEIEHFLLNTFRWISPLHGLSYGVIIKSIRGRSVSFYYRTFEYGCLNGMHEKLLEKLAHTENVLNIFHDVALTYDDLLLFRSNHDRTKRKIRCLNNAKSRMSDIFKNWNCRRENTQVVSCYISQAESSHVVSPFFFQKNLSCYYGIF